MFFAVLLVCSVNAFTISNVESSPKEVEAGKRVTLTLTIDNNLKDNVENVDLALDLTNLPFSPTASSEISIGEIKENHDLWFDIGLNVDSDAKSGIYKIPVKISYEINSVAKTKTAYVSVIVNSQPLLETSSESLLMKNKKNKLSVKIINSGLGDAKFLEVEVKDSLEYKIIGNKKIYVGSLDSDDFEIANFEISIKEKSLISIPVILRYKDSLNNEREKEDTLNLKAYSQKEAQNLGMVKKSNIMLYIIIVVFIVLVIIGYRRIKKRKREG